MLQLNQIYNPENSELTLEQAKAIFARMNRVFIASPLDVDQTSNIADQYYKNHPGDDYA